MFPQMLAAGGGGELLKKIFGHVIIFTGNIIFPENNKILTEI
jgi:hypothetical protein